jgi:hypothetical protein
MAWSTPPTFSTSELVPASKLTQLSDDLSYLLNRPKASTFRDNGATYTTTSTSFTPIDSTNLSYAINMSGSVALITVLGQTDDNGTNQTLFFDIEVDAVRLGAGATDGLCGNQHGTISAADDSLSMAVIRSGLTASSHTFRPVWRVSGGTGRIHSGNGVAGTDYLLHFGVAEIG